MHSIVTCGAGRLWESKDGLDQTNYGNALSSLGDEEIDGARVEEKKFH